MEELRVPKRAVPVQLRLAGGSTVEVHVFLADLGDGRERLSDVLEGPSSFLAAVSPGAGTVLVRRDSIVVARVAREIETAGLDPAMTPIEARVEVLLTDGTAVEGLLRYVAGEEHARVLDHLNEPARFFALWSGDVVALVAKAHVARVTPA